MLGQRCRKGALRDDEIAWLSTLDAPLEVAIARQNGHRTPEVKREYQLRDIERVQMHWGRKVQGVGMKIRRRIVAGADMAVHDKSTCHHKDPETGEAESSARRAEPRVTNGD